MSTSRARSRSLARRALMLALAAVLGGLGLAPPTAVAGPAGGFAGSAVDAGSAGPPVSSPATAGYLPGIDVSRWQNEIDWAQVAASGQRFVFMKATEGRNYEDPMYPSYRAGAVAAGLIVGAYHFARPDSTKNDAILEADHFVSVAQVVAGNLLPVLDIETSGGLSPEALTQWALDWLGEVQAQTGVRALVYTSPNGWKNRFGDTTAIADAGYPLWIAHCGVNAPTVPAADWAGRGWTFWQYTDCGSVPGIGGCVDLDWFGGTDLGAATIRRLTVTLSAPNGIVTSLPAGIDCGSVCSANFDPVSAITLTATADPGAVFRGWTGACLGTGPCVVTMDGDRSVTATFVTDITPPTVEISAPTSLIGQTTFTFSENVHDVTPSDVQLRTTLTGTGVRSSLACLSAKGATVDCATGKVRTVQLRPVEPLIPGELYTALVNPAGATTLVVDKAENAAAQTTFGFAGTPEVDQGSAGLRWAWATRAKTSAYGGSYAVEDLTGASASFTFRGKTVTWYTIEGPTQGKAEVLIDGRSRGVFDQYAPTSRYRVGRTFGGLAPGEHTIAVRVRGKGSANATDTLVAVDAFGVGKNLVKTPALEVSWSMVKAAGAQDGRVALGDLHGASVSMTFRGTAVDWLTARGPDQGKASIYVDGSLIHTVDNFASTRSMGVTRSVTGLADGLHTLRIVVTGTARKAATGTRVTIDGFVVHPAA